MDDALRQAAMRGLEVLSARQTGTSLPRRAVGRGRFSLLLFAQELLALLEAGLNLTEALSTLHAKEPQPQARALLQGLLDVVHEGGSFSEALARAPATFPDVFIATVRASERTGDIGHALARYVTYQAQLDTVMKKLLATSLYPALLLLVGGGVSLFLLGYVVPRFAAVYEASGQQVQGPSAWLLQLGLLVHTHADLVLLACALAMAAMALLLAHAPSRQWLRERLLLRLLRLPGLRRRSEAFRMARFYRALSLLLASGIALPRAMGMATGLLDRSQQVRLRLCRERVEQGVPLSAALAQAGLSNPVAQSLLKVGERSGRLADMLERIARFADDDFARWMDWASRLLEPVLMLCIGGVIGTVVVLMYLPIFELAGGLQ